MEEAHSETSWSYLGRPVIHRLASSAPICLVLSLFFKLVPLCRALPKGRTTLISPVSRRFRESNFFPVSEVGHDMRATDDFSAPFVLLSLRTAINKIRFHFDTVLDFRDDLFLPNISRSGVCPVALCIGPDRGAVLVVL